MLQFKANMLVIAARLSAVFIIHNDCNQNALKVTHLVNSGGSRILKRGRRIERRGTNGRIATAHGHRPRWWLPPPVWKGEAAAPYAP